jgi:hypothetical protein
MRACSVHVVVASTFQLRCCSMLQLRVSPWTIGDVPQVLTISDEAKYHHRYH